jgi:hypothetical protein
MDKEILDIYGVTEERYSDWQSAMQIVADTDENVCAGEILKRIKLYYAQFPGHPGQGMKKSYLGF